MFFGRVKHKYYVTQIKAFVLLKRGGGPPKMNYQSLLSNLDYTITLHSVCVFVGLQYTSMYINEIKIETRLIKRHGMKKV